MYRLVGFSKNSVRHLCRRHEIRKSLSMSRSVTVAKTEERDGKIVNDNLTVKISGKANWRDAEQLDKIPDLHSEELQTAYGKKEMLGIVCSIPQITNVKPKKVKDGKAIFDVRREEIVSSLSSFVDAYMNSGKYTYAMLCVEVHARKLRDIQFQCGLSYAENIPISIYNKLLAGFARSRNFRGAREVRGLMKVHKHPLEASSYGFLLATVNGRDNINELLNSMKQSKISLNDVFNETEFTAADRQNSLRAVRSVKEYSNYTPPLKNYTTYYRTKLLSDLKQKRVDFKRPKEPIVGLAELKDKFEQQWSQEISGFAKVKSIEAAAHTSNRVKFLRQQIAAQEADWKNQLRRALDIKIEATQDRALNVNHMSVHPFILCISPSFLVDVMHNEVRKLTLSSDTFGFGLTNLCRMLGEKIEERFVIELKTKNGYMEKLRKIYETYLNECDCRDTRNSREAWLDLLSKNSNWGPSMEQKYTPWPTGIRASVGKFLYDIIVQIKFDVNMAKPNSKEKQMMNALYTVSSWRLELRVHEILSTLYKDAHLEEFYFDITSVPMLTPPKPWINTYDTPFLLTQTPLINRETAIKTLTSVHPHNLNPSFDALNALSKVPWKINKPILEVITKVFLENSGEHLSITPHPKTLTCPSLKKLKTKSEIRQVLGKFERQKCAHYSLWCDLLHKLSIANHFKDEVFWFPYKMDFRGRTYPCPPHFNHLGSDAVRSLLLFAEGKPLGPNGFNWLKIHLVNLTGLKKREPIAKRLEFANENMDEILDSANNPLTGRKWWQNSDDPWQTLAACCEVAKVIQSGINPEDYICHFPIHQDGTCNGLQHYAALGRDIEGATQVNLSPMDKPQDVYTGVAELVETARAKDAEKGVEIAKVLEGHIQRRVVKRTIMTVVYGVTKFGARLQILEELEDCDIPEEYLDEASSYVTEKTFESLLQVFGSARRIQDWFGRCATLISEHSEQPVSWVTPLGLPVLQPYFMATVDATTKSFFDDEDSHCKPNPAKQKFGFAPNFIHSLDSSHMMLTSIFCEAAGICFVSVHDCFWTHPCSVEAMNDICRQQFVALHNEPILENLHDQFVKLYRNKQDDVSLLSMISDIPEKGEFNLNDVLKSTYFFN